MTTPAQPPNPMLDFMRGRPADPYYADFGRFITGHARTEGVVRGLLRHLVGTSETDTAALFHRLQLTDMIATIDRLIAARGLDKLALDIKEPVAQLRAIAEIRNALVHWGSTLDDVDGLVAKNTHRAHLKDNVVEYRVSSDQLLHMYVDLMKIDLHILFAYHGPPSPEGIADTFKRVRDSAWSYIRPQPGQQGKGTAPPHPQ